MRDDWFDSGVSRHRAIFFSKSVEFFTQKRRLKREQLQLADARSLDQASDIAAGFSAKASAHSSSMKRRMNWNSQGSEDNEGIKERTGFRLERRVAAVGRYMGQATVIWRRSAPFPLRRVVWHRMGHYE